MSTNQGSESWNYSHPNLYYDKTPPWLVWALYTLNCCVGQMESPSLNLIQGSWLLHMSVNSVVAFGGPRSLGVTIYWVVFTEGAVQSLCDFGHKYSWYTWNSHITEYCNSAQWELKLQGCDSLLQETYGLHHGLWHELVLTPTPQKSIM